MSKDLLKQNITMGINVTLEDIAENISVYLSHEEIIEFIKRLDRDMEDWDATVELMEYFIDECDDYLLDCGDVQE